MQCSQMFSIPSRSHVMGSHAAAARAARLASNLAADPVTLGFASQVRFNEPSKYHQ